MIRAHHGYHLLSLYNMSDLVLRSGTNTSVLSIGKIRLREINLLTQSGNRVTPNPRPISHQSPSCALQPHISFMFPHQSPRRCQQKRSNRSLTLYNNCWMVIQLLQENVLCLIADRTSNIHTEQHFSQLSLPLLTFKTQFKN